jgi:NAD(P)-dependent dehydrogenase (short-subunit alcohol dehydrogenase family)
MKDVIVLLGTGSIGRAIARRVGVGKHIVLADLREENANAAAEVLGEGGYDVSVLVVDVSSRASVHTLAEKAAALGPVTGVIHAAGVSPSQASPAAILKVDLYGTALVLEQFGNVIARGGSGIVIASQSGHRLPGLTVAQNNALATTPADELLALPLLSPNAVTDPLYAYQISKRCNALRVMAEAVRWGRRGARINTISPGNRDHPIGAGRAQRASGRRVPPTDRAESCRPRGHTRRGRESGCTGHGPRRWVHHGKRFLDGRWCDGGLLVRRAGDGSTEVLVPVGQAKPAKCHRSPGTPISVLWDRPHRPRCGQTAGDRDFVIANRSSRCGGPR